MERSLVFGLTFLSMVTVTLGTTRTLEKGPPAKAEKEADDHLFQIYVLPPKRQKDYSPGEILIYLKREHPDYMYVPLKYDRLKDGRLHVQIAISPEKEKTYVLNVLDRQPDGQCLLLYSRNLRDIKNKKAMNRSTGAAVGRVF